jgi:hypothetical protein
MRVVACIGMVRFGMAGEARFCTTGQVGDRHGRRSWFGSGMSRRCRLLRGMAGEAGSVMACPGAASYCGAWQARRVEARRGKSGYGRAWQARRGMERPARAGCGMAWQARPGAASRGLLQRCWVGHGRQGWDGRVEVSCGLAGLGRRETARCGTAWQGSPGHGLAGTVRQALAWRGMVPPGRQRYGTERRRGSFSPMCITGG